MYWSSWSEVIALSRVRGTPEDLVVMTTKQSAWKWFPPPSSTSRNSQVVQNVKQKHRNTVTQGQTEAIRFSL